MCLFTSCVDLVLILFLGVWIADGLNYTKPCVFRFVGGGSVAATKSCVYERINTHHSDALIHISSCKAVHVASPAVCLGSGFQIILACACTPSSMSSSSSSSSSDSDSNSTQADRPVDDDSVSCKSEDWWLVHKISKLHSILVQVPLSHQNVFPMHASELPGFYCRDDGVWWWRIGVQCSWPNKG